MRWGKRKKEGERFFLKNGGKMLEQIITSFNGKCNPIRSFSEKELIEATNNFDQRKLTHEDWNSYMYEGTNESRPILVKMFKKERLARGASTILEKVTNEIAIASNMSNHSNFLKLLGCCLETEIPILVYEFGVNLSYEIINSLPWETKLRIANEMANAFSYLHYGTPRMIIHRDIKIGHIYLKQGNIAKVSEFHASVVIPLGKTHVHTQERYGTYGYVDPEYVKNGRLTEKTDVFTFGIVLMEILAGKRIREIEEYYHDKLQRHISEESDVEEYDHDILQRHIFEESDVIDHRDLFEITYRHMVRHQLKSSVVKEEISRQEIEFGELILKCLRYDPDARPTMQEVAQTLKSIRNMSL